MDVHDAQNICAAATKLSKYVQEITCEAGAEKVEYDRVHKIYLNLWTVAMAMNGGYSLEVIC
jgi:hypothetical protein